MHSTGFSRERTQPSAKVLRESAALAGIKFHKGQKTTPARRREDRDLRNMATMAAVNSLYGDVPMQLMGNVDTPGLRGGHQATRRTGKNKAPVVKKQAQALTRVGRRRTCPIFATGDPKFQSAHVKCASQGTFIYTNVTHVDTSYSRVECLRIKNGIDCEITLPRHATISPRYKCSGPDNSLS